MFDVPNLISEEEWLKKEEERKINSSKNSLGFPGKFSIMFINYNNKEFLEKLPTKVAIPGRLRITYNPKKKNF